VCISIFPPDGSSPQQFSSENLEDSAVAACAGSSLILVELQQLR
jgi:hypothetical protein